MKHRNKDSDLPKQELGAHDPAPSQGNGDLTRAVPGTEAFPKVPSRPTKSFPHIGTNANISVAKMIKPATPGSQLGAVLEALGFDPILLGRVQVAIVLIPGINELVALDTLTSKRVPEQLASEEPLFLEGFGDASAKKTLKLLKGFCVTGCAYQSGAASLGEAVQWLGIRNCQVPCSKTQLNKYFKNASALFDKYMRASSTTFGEIIKHGPVQLEQRDESTERLRDSKGRPLGGDGRPIINLSEAGKWAWAETVKFLRKRDPAFCTYEHLIPVCLTEGD